MGLGGCYSVMKYLVVFINLVCWVYGIFLIILSIWSLADDPFYVSIAKDQFGVFILLGVGILLFIVGFLGCCGILRSSKVLLTLFICVLLLILVAEISFAVWAYSNSDDLDTLVRESVKVTVEEEYGEDDARTKSFDIIQRDLQCCGATNAHDWLSNKHASKNKILDMAISSKTNDYKIPLSCCKEPPPSVNCKVKMDGWTSTNYSTPAIANYIYTEGCADKLIQLFYSYKNWWIIGGLILIITQICGLIFSLILCCSMQKPPYSAINTRNRM